VAGGLMGTAAVAGITSIHLKQFHERKQCKLDQIIDKNRMKLKKCVPAT
jgi:hypothetical protein